MDGEQESIAQEAEAPIEGVEPEEEALEPIEGEELAQPEEDLEEFDWNGKKIMGPKGLKDGVLMQADYTRKTQEVAETKKQLEARAAQIEQQFKASDEEMNARAAMISIESDLKSYENVDWDKWEAEDLFAAQAGYRKYQQLKDARGQVAGYLGERQKARTEQTQLETTKRLQETRQFAETQIKGWTPELDSKITDFATKELGFDWNTLKSAYNPIRLPALYLAHIGHAALQKQTTAPKPAAAAGRSNPSPR
jgi:Asp-tRNA(Asn)/Glu-tRNA(Gln) amidotransferase A subunit family amidase